MLRNNRCNCLHRKDVGRRQDIETSYLCYLEPESQAMIELALDISIFSLVEA
jgi:hypothetical protein